jgi:hypothetical protein
VPLAHEGERVRSRDDLLARREVRAGVLVLGRPVQADLDPADGLADLVEAQQVDLGVVVDGHPADVLDDLPGRAAGSRHGFGVDPGLVGDAVLAQLPGGGELRQPEGRVDLVLAQLAGKVHIGVARDRERLDLLLAVRDPEHDERVGEVVAVRPGPQFPQDLGRQRALLVVGPRVAADQQDVDGAVRRLLTGRGLVSAADHVGADQARLQ